MPNLDIELKPHTCPLSKLLFFFPMRAQECGHVFEKEEILTWLEGASTECPAAGCEHKIDKNNLAFDMPIYNKVVALIHKKPSLIFRQYFPIFMFANIIQDKCQPRNADKLFLPNLIKILEVKSEILNQVNPTFGYSPLFILANSAERGHAILAENSALRSNITFAGLNASCGLENQKNLTPLLMLLALSEPSRNIFAKDPDLRRKIDPNALALAAEFKGSGVDGFFPLLLLTNEIEVKTENEIKRYPLLYKFPKLINNIPPQALNAICMRGKYKGTSPVLSLASKPSGRKLLHDYPHLRRNIQSVSLETISEAKGYNEGITPLFFFVETEEGLNLSKMDNGHLANAITPKALNTICKVGPYKGTSPVLFFACNSSGRKLLLDYPHLRRSIQSVSLETISEAKGYNEGISPLFLFVEAGEGLNLLSMDDGHLTKLITPTALNTICKIGRYKGTSPVLLLARDPRGRKLLLDHPHLRRNIQPTTLETISESKDLCEGISPLFFFADSEEGLNLLSMDDGHLAKLITPTALNTIYKIGTYKGVSPVLLFACEPTGRKLLHDYPHLRRNIHSVSLETISEAKGLCEGITPLFLFANTEEGRNLLSMDDGHLAKLITPTALNTICTIGPNKGASPVLLFANNPAGRKLLHDYPHLRHNIQSVALETISEAKGCNEGISPLFFFAGTEDGLNLLSMDDGHLAKLITPAALNTICKIGPFKGTSLVFLLIGRLIGKKLLRDYPHLRRNIQPATLETISESKECDEGISPLFYFAGSEEGFDLLSMDDGHLAKLITPTALNTICKISPYKGASPVLLLARGPRGRKLLLDYPHLRHNIQSVSLETISEAKDLCEGISPLFFFADSEEGLNLLSMDDGHLAKLITPTALNTVCKIGTNKGTSLVFLLAGRSNGKKLLRDYPHLRRNIQPATLETISEAKKCDEGISPLFFFTGSEEGIDLLRMDDGHLAKLITPAALNTLCQTGPYKGTTPAYFLITKQAGCEFLDKFPHIRKMITLETLCAVRENGKDEGVFPLLMLASSQAGGLALLNKAPDLQQKITADALLQVCQKDPNRGLSPFLLLKETALLIHMLKSNPALRKDLGNKISQSDKQYLESKGISFTQEDKKEETFQSTQHEVEIKAAESKPASPNKIEIKVAESKPASPNEWQERYELLHKDGRSAFDKHVLWSKSVREHTFAESTQYADVSLEQPDPNKKLLLFGQAK